MKLNAFAFVLSMGLASSLAAPVLASGTTAAIADKIEVYPQTVALRSKRDCRQVVVTGYFHGLPRDLTRTAVFSNRPRDLVTIDNGMMRAAANGTEHIRITASGRTIDLPVSVSGVQDPDPVSFKFETLPVLTRQGCSTGSCHGAPHGKGGFVLSLFGYNPQMDRVSLTRDGLTRRVDLMQPADSLIIKKPMLELPHVGGKRLHRQDEGYRVLFNWISEGAYAELPATECSSIEVYPKGEQRLGPDAATRQISVLAHYSNGQIRDVTRICAFDTSSASAATVDSLGYVTGHSRGQTAISVRYLDKLLSVHFTMTEPTPGFKWNEPRPTNDIDRLVNEKLQQLQYLPSPVCSDSEFVRRVYLDLTGLLPSADQTRDFLADNSPDKRVRVVDKLLNSEEYARFWALKRADLMRVTPNRLKEGRAELYSDWIVDSIRQNMPYDRFARSLVTASGDTKKSPAACYFVAIPTQEERTEMTAEIFMGSRVECARCHNHPFENWTMRDYYSIGAVFARTQADDKMVRLASTGEATNPTTGEVMAPFGVQKGVKLGDGDDRRVTFADWLVQPSNPYFARVAVNRIWASLMGRGIVEPIDDFRSSNPPSNGPLLDHLATEFIHSGYDCKALIQYICSSKTYQRSAGTNASNRMEDQLFSHARVRMLTAEQLKDAVGQVTHTLPSPTVARHRYATEASFPENSTFTQTFGQPERTSSCACERQTAPTLLQALELLNGGTLYTMAGQSTGYYFNLPDDKLVEDLYLAALSRKPTEKEASIARGFLKRSVNRNSEITDLVWSLLNTREFIFQH